MVRVVVDALYGQLATRLDAPLLTTDHRLTNQASGQASSVARSAAT